MEQPQRHPYTDADFYAQLSAMSGNWKSHCPFPLFVVMHFGPHDLDLLLTSGAPTEPRLSDCCPCAVEEETESYLL